MPRPRSGEYVYCGGHEVLVPDLEDVLDPCRACGDPNPDSGEDLCWRCRAFGSRNPNQKGA